MKSTISFLRRAFASSTFSPTAFVVRAVILAALFGISELAGLREYTTFLSGTSANLNVSWQTASTLGLIHLLLYVAFILLVPVCLITAGLLVAWNRWPGQRSVSIKASETTVSTPSPMRDIRMAR